MTECSQLLDKVFAERDIIEITEPLRTLMRAILKQKSTLGMAKRIPPDTTLSRGHLTPLPEISAVNTHKTQKNEAKLGNDNKY